MKLDEIRSLEEAEKMHSLRVEDAKLIWKKYSKTFELRDCPICGSLEYIPVESFHGTFGVSQCIKCNTPFVNPAPSAESLMDFYNNGASNKLLNSLYKKRNLKGGTFVVDQRVNRISRLIGEKFVDKGEVRILEVGCNQGGFLFKLKNHLEDQFTDKVFKFFGVDIDKSAIENSIDSDLNLKHGTAENFAETNPEWRNSFDVVCHFELIEHLVSPKEFCIAIKNVMKPDAFMVFTTPNLDGAEIKASHYNDYRLLAHTIVPPFHINSFGTKNISLFSFLNGFYIDEVTTPGQLDVDCIEKYSDKAKSIKDVYRQISKLGETEKAWLQSLIVELDASSSMMVVLRNDQNC